MKLQPSDFIIQFLSEYRHEQTLKFATQKPEFKVCDVIGSNTFMIASKHIGFPCTHAEMKGFARPLWCLDIFGSLDNTKPYSLSSLKPHWIWSENLTDDLYLDDDSVVLLDKNITIYWDELDLSGDRKESYSKCLDDLMGVARSYKLFPFEYKPVTQKIIIDAWLAYWHQNTYKFKVHNHLNFGLPFDKHVIKIHKLTIKKGCIYVSYEMKGSNGKKCSTILSKKKIDTLTSSCEQFVTYAPRFDGIRSKGDVLIIKAWEILERVDNDRFSQMKEITTVIKIGKWFYRVDRKITDEHLKPAKLELPKDYKYAPSENIYDAVFHPVIVGNNSDVASNFYIDPLAHSLRDSTFYKELKEKGKSKTNPQGFAPSHGLKSTAQEMQEYDTFKLLDELGYLEETEE